MFYFISINVFMDLVLVNYNNPVIIKALQICI